MDKWLGERRFKLGQPKGFSWEQLLASLSRAEAGYLRCFGHRISASAAFEAEMSCLRQCGVSRTPHFAFLLETSSYHPETEQLAEGASQSPPRPLPADEWLSGSFGGNVVMGLRGLLLVGRACQPCTQPQPQLLIQCWAQLQLALLGLQIPAGIEGRNHLLGAVHVAEKGAKYPWNSLRSPFSLRGCILVVARCGDVAPCSMFHSVLMSQENGIFTSFSLPSHFCVNMKESSETLNKKRQVLPTVLKHLKTSTDLADSTMECS